MTKRYVVGFIFTPDYSQVLLIQKNRPEWQAGRINGVGGKIEPGEKTKKAVQREIWEETSLDISDWTKYAEVRFGEGIVHFFATVYEGDINNAKSMTDEQIGWYPVNKLPEQVIDNLHWLVPLAKDVLKFKIIKKAIVQHHE